MLGLGPLLLSLTGRLFSIFQDKGILLVSIAMAGAVGSFILSGIAVRRSRARPEPVATHQRAGVCLAVASLIILAGFFLLTGAAQFTVGFYLHFAGF